MTTEQDPRWAAILARDPKADALFVYGVKTTGVYCRPSSASRLPRPENIEFFDTPAQAEAAGYRASKRAAGDQTQRAAQDAQRVADACRHIEQADTPPSLNALATLAGLSAFHFHRIFKAVTGLTPKAYASAHGELVGEAIKRSPQVSVDGILRDLQAELGMALCLSQERRLETAQQGTAFFALVASSWPHPAWPGA